MADVADAKLGPARDRLDPGGACEVQLDGGGRVETAEIIGRGGTDVIVAGTALYRRRRHGGRGRADPLDRRTRPGRRRCAAPPARPGVRALLQRVSRAEVRVEGGPVGAIGPGLLVLLGVGRTTTSHRRRAGAPDRRAADVRGRRGSDEPLAARRRRRGARRQPVHALRGHLARASAGVHGRRARRTSRGPCLRVAHAIEALGVRTALGEFGAEMEVELVNDGPFTIWLDTDRKGPDRR